MKNKLVILFALAFAFVACENQENSFPDFGSTSVYFPFQTPARTLIQGKYDLGFNENDNLGRFEIGLIMSGVYENKVDRKVGFELAPEIIDAALLGVDTVNVKALPSSYYTIEQESPVTIPAGSTSGRIPVQLNDAFFDDPLSFAGDNDVHYVIPLKITNYQNLDSLLTGVPTVDNPIRIRNEDWSVLPKDYTLFGIKYINKYHGIYLRRGTDKILGSSVNEYFKKSGGVFVPDATKPTETVVIDTTSVYRADYVVQDDTTPLTASGKNSVIYSNKVRRGSIASEDNITIKMTFDENGNITIEDVEGDDFVVTGLGKFVEDGDEWGGEKRNVIYLEYEYDEADKVSEELTGFGQNLKRSTLSLSHVVNDTLVIRDRDVKFEEFTINLEKQ